MKEKLTARTVKLFQPQLKVYEVVDTELKGFLLRVQPSGAKTYYYSYRNPVRKKVRYRIGNSQSLTAIQAREIARQLMLKVALGTDIQANKTNAITKSKITDTKTLRYFLDHYYESWVLATHKSGNKTVKAIRRDFKQFIDLSLEDITLLKIEKWKVAALNKGLKESTINRKLSRIRSILSKAQEWKMIETHPLKDLKRIKEDTNPIVRFLSEHEEHRLRTYLRQRDKEKRQQRATHNQWLEERAKPLLPDFSQQVFVDHVEPMILLAMHSGLRKSVLLNLRWDHVNFEECYVTAIGYDTKNKKTRYVPLNDEALYILKMWRQQSQNDIYAFLNPKTKKPFTTIEKAWRKVLIHAGITHFRWHDLRHHFASKLTGNGVDLNLIRELLGHSSLDMTLRYAHLAPKHKAEAVSSLINTHYLKQLKETSPIDE